MTDLMEKTVGTLSTLFSNVGLVSGSDSKTKSKILSIWNFDKETFLKKLKAAVSIKEEETIITNFLTSAEKQLSLPNVTETEVEIYVQLAMVCECHGFPTPFIYVHAIKLAQKGNLQQKHTGYLAVTSLLHPHHELVILLTNTIQKDLESSNYAEVLLGLKAVSNLINEDTVHNVLYLVQERVKHENSEVRKLAVLTLGHCLQLVNSESAYKMALPQLEKALTDSNLGVVSAVVPVLYNLIKSCPGDYEYLVACLIQLQNQLLRRQLPSYMEYQCIPAPFLQIKILKLLSLLCRSPEQCSKVYPTLKVTLQKAEVNHQIGYAIIAEVIETIVSIEHNQEMIELALSVAGKFLNAEGGNLKYTGVQAFTRIVQTTKKPSLTSAQQAGVMECLNHFDETLKLKTLELLYHLVNPSNAQEICRRMVDYIISKKEHVEKRLVLQALEIANQYNQDSKWYIHTINLLLSEVGDLVPSEKISEIIDIIHKDANGDLKTMAKQTYINMCRTNFPQGPLVKIICSILDDPVEFEVILPYFEKLDCETNLWILILLRNAIVTTKKSSDKLSHLVNNLQISSKDIQQIQSEITCIMTLIESIGDLQLKNRVDVTMSHLDEYVCKSLSSGHPCYKPQRLRVADISEKADFKCKSQNTSEVSSISWDPDVEQKPLSPSKSLSYTSISSSSLPVQSQSSSEFSYNSKIKNIWTKEGRITESESDANSPFEQVSVDSMETAKLFAGIS